jgi:NB-ARC domain/Rx N-terminal domain
MNFIWEKVVDFLVSAIGQTAVDRWQQNSTVGRSISDLQAALPKARFLIERSECWRLPKYKHVNELLPQLKDAVYQAESMVDEFEYQHLKNESEKSLLGPGNYFLRNWMNDFPTSVKMALDRLNSIYNQLKEICDHYHIPEDPNKFSKNARPPTSTFSNTKVYGRDEEVDEVIHNMGIPKNGQIKMCNLDPGESSRGTNKKGKISVLSIVGMGGVGKTTLAQEVCNDERVTSYFDFAMWVCVSDNFDLVKLTKEIIQSAYLALEATAKNSEKNEIIESDPAKYNLHVDKLNTLKNTLEGILKSDNLNTLQNTFKGILKSERVLLVLDDVWSKDWQHLLVPMEGASQGSVVMVTTRSLEDVDIGGTDMEDRGVIKLEGLAEHIYWHFFKFCVFDSVPMDILRNYIYGEFGSVDNFLNLKPEFKAIGKEVCHRLKGSPLAAKTIGGLLGMNLDVRHWTVIKDSAMWQLKQKEHDIHPVLQLSYQYLPSQLKKCISVCSLYPKDFKFTKWELTKLWIMQGFIDLQQLEVHWEEPYIKEAEEYLHELVRRCFFQKSAGYSYDHEYVIHDLMHDVCQSITRDECLCLEDSDLKKNVSPNIRHLSIFRKGVEVQEQNELLSKYDKLLSLRVEPYSSCCYAAIKNWCKKLFYIRSLSLSKCKISELPNSIGELKHLRYLDISFTDIEKFPVSFCSLYNLVYLNMQDCSRFMFFPEEFNKLVNLCFLFLPTEKLILLGHMEKYAKQVRNKDMNISISNYVKIEYLKFMDGLRGHLEIGNLGDVPGKQAAEEARLNHKKEINCLSLCWSQSFQNNHDEVVLEGLSPHPNLKELKIFRYGGTNLSPSWLKDESLPNLTELRIQDFVRDFTMFHLQCSITTLVIWRCKELTNFMSCNFGPNQFPALKHLGVGCCTKLVSLPVESFGDLVSLESLRITFCKNLTCPNAMVLPPSLQLLSLNSCGELENSLPSCLQNLTSLEKLEISGCKNLVSVPADVTSNLKSLSSLRVESCTNLQLFGESGFLKSVQEHFIRDCPKLEETGGKNITLPSGNYLIGVFCVVPFILNIIELRNI